MWQHKHHVFPGFTTDYKIDRLVYFERYSSLHAAIAREKQIKGLVRPGKQRTTNARRASLARTAGGGCPHAFHLQDRRGGT